MPFTFHLLLVQMSCLLMIQQNFEKAFPDPRTSIYRYEAFMEGTVYFTNGTKTKARLNYNYQYGQLQFIGSNHDTLLLTGKGQIRHIEIADAVFYVSEDFGDAEVIVKSGGSALVRKTQWAIAGDKTSHSDQKYTSGENSLPTSLFVASQGGSLQWFNNTAAPKYKIKSNYYLVDYNRRFHETTRASFLYVYARDKMELQKYLLDNRVDFKNEADLRAFFNFCNRSF